VIFAIRTRRIPFFRSRASVPLTLAALGVVTLGAILPATPLAHVLGFAALPLAFYAALVGMVLVYLALVELGKRYFDRATPAKAPAPRRDPRLRLLGHRVGRFSVDGNRGSDRAQAAAIPTTGAAPKS
jgi:Mg2+-importing ATPase